MRAPRVAASDRIGMTLIVVSQLRAPTTGPRDEADQKGINRGESNSLLQSSQGGEKPERVGGVIPAS
jgi:hypothetical protein